MTVAKQRHPSAPFRQHRTPQPYLQLTPATLQTDAEAVLWRLDELWRSRGCGAELFIDDMRRCYVICSESTAAVQWIREHDDWWRGTFRAGCGVEVIANEIA